MAKKQQYVLAARALGYSRTRVMPRHIRPAPSRGDHSPMVDAIGNIILAAALSFLGLGVQPPHQSGAR